MESTHHPYIHHFKSNINHIDLPDQFAFPFDYTPHTIAIIAAKQLQDYLTTRKDWFPCFGMGEKPNIKSMGKMFGVLVVKNKYDQLGYIQSFSGMVNGETNHDAFVPPIFDRQSDASPYAQKEKEIMDLTKSIDSLTHHIALIHAQGVLSDFISHNEPRIKKCKSE